MNYSLNLSNIDFSTTQCVEIVYNQPPLYIILIPLVIGIITSSWALFDTHTKKGVINKKLFYWSIFVTWLSLQLILFIINYYFI